VTSSDGGLAAVSSFVRTTTSRSIVAVITPPLLPANEGKRSLRLADPR
jgi:hypothetical protein